jgi:hypothetical protein
MSSITAEAKKAGEKVVGKVAPLTPDIRLKDCAYRVHLSSHSSAMLWSHIKRTVL